MMTLKKLRYLAEAYGSDLSRWPDTDANSASQLLVTSPAARSILLSQRETDDIVSRAFRAHDIELSLQSTTEDQNAALSRVRAGIAGHINTHQRRQHFSFGFAGALPFGAFANSGSIGFGNHLLALRRTGMAFGCAFVLTGGLWLGWIQNTGGTGDIFNALLALPVSGG